MSKKRFRAESKITDHSDNSAEIARTIEKFIKPEKQGNSTLMTWLGLIVSVNRG
jgi:hypothetical protein